MRGRYAESASYEEGRKRARAAYAARVADGEDARAWALRGVRTDPVGDYTFGWKEGLWECIQEGEVGGIKPSDLLPESALYRRWDCSCGISPTILHFGSRPATLPACYAWPPSSVRCDCGGVLNLVEEEDAEPQSRERTGADALRDAAAADRVCPAQQEEWERPGDPDDYPADAPEKCPECGAADRPCHPACTRRREAGE